MNRHNEGKAEFIAGYHQVAGRRSREGAIDARDFFESNFKDLLIVHASGLSWNRLGNDFYFTRNQHGAGYWDEKYRGSEADHALDRLTKAAHVYGSTDDH